MRRNGGHGRSWKEEKEELNSQKCLNYKREFWKNKKEKIKKNLKEKILGLVEIQVSLKIIIAESLI